MEELLEFGQIDSEVSVALRASEPGQAMRDIENGLAVSARHLDLRLIDAMGRHVLLQLLRRRRLRRRRCGGRGNSLEWIFMSSGGSI